MATGFNDKVLALYAKEISVREIRQIVEELYGIEFLAELISTVT